MTPRPQPSVVRAWMVGHDARSVALTSGLATIVLCVGASWLLPSVGNPRPVQLWQLTPPLLAMLASYATVNQLPEGTGGHVRIARASWVLLVLGGAVVCARAVDLAAGLPSLVPESVVLVALSVGGSAVLGRGAVWIGAIAAASTVLRYSTLPAFADPWRGVTSWWVGATIVMAVAGVAAYVGFGAGTLGRKRPWTGA